MVPDSNEREGALYLFLGSPTTRGDGPRAILKHVTATLMVVRYAGSWSGKVSLPVWKSYSYTSP